MANKSKCPMKMTLHLFFSSPLLTNESRGQRLLLQTQLCNLCNLLTWAIII